MAGEIVHVEFPSADIERAQRFWHGLFGWDFKDSGMPGMDYRIARTGEMMASALFEQAERAGYPNYYFNVADIEAALAKIRELGGETEPKSPVAAMGWLAKCRDSEGNTFHLWQADTAAA